MRNIIAGSYKLVVTNNGKKGTYELRHRCGRAQTFVLRAAPRYLRWGAERGCGQFGDRRVGGRLHVHHHGDWQLGIDISDCDRSLLGLGALPSLIDTATNDSVSQGWSCWSQMFSSLPAGDYRLVIDNGGRRAPTIDASLQP